MHAGAKQGTGTKNLALIGNPNVGKSVIFGLLTGKYVVVSNYTGTTVEVSRGISSFDGDLNVIDTPGINSLIPASEDEKVTRDILLEEAVDHLIQVADAKNLSRSLLISLQLSEAGLPFVLDLNMEDEARSRGVYINKKELSRILGVPVVSTVATRREGIRELIKSLSSAGAAEPVVHYGEKLEAAIEQIIPLLPSLPVSPRFIAVMMLSGDQGVFEVLADKLSIENTESIRKVIADTEALYSRAPGYVITQHRMEAVKIITEKVMRKEKTGASPFSATLGNLAMHPVWGIPVVLFVMFVTFQIVGVFGAGICVDFLESVVFEQGINPLLTRIFSYIPVPLIQELFTGEYGVLTMSLTYAVAIVLPIVTLFFIVFGLLEDSGYLPRLAIMVNRLFKRMGLNGKAVLPMILGLGCDTMATMTARILPSRKERIIVTLLLALAVPCSAQLGVIFGATAGISALATVIWLVTIVIVIFVVGFLSSKIIPGQSADFILEVPPMRMPKISNILIKTLARVQWYLKEAVPLFMLGTFVLFILNKTGGLKLIENLAAPVVVNLLQLPKEVAGAFVMGFLRRDYAAVMIAKSGLLDGTQLLVAIVTITLFVPCVANLFIMIKERGIKTALLITLFIFTFAFLFGALFNLIIRGLPVAL